MNGHAEKLKGVGLTHVTYRLPSQCLSLEEMGEQHLLESDASFLRDLGFGQSFVRNHETSDDVIDDMAVDCGRDVLDRSGIATHGVRWLLRYTGLPDEGSPEGDLLTRFRYPVAHAQERLDLNRASSIALSQQGCSGLLSSLFLANRLLQGEDDGAVLCLAGDALPRGRRREILYNVMSDAAGAVLVERNATRNRLLHFVQHAMPYYWDTPRHATEVLASYFPLAHRVITRTLDEAGLTTDDVTWVVPHNVSLRSWIILARLLDIPSDRIWSHNIARIGHTVSCDHLINLRDMEDQGILQSGDILLLFTFGFGANWTCLLLEH